ncbi:BON domain-containing protein [Burkholderia seminalis]|uniref:BON domain-containing protein n=1 Tax=Burkholderia seminalis TaxID=488731 RepID=UPI002652F7BD|nr:BON domain-containing protein [Burkholderia seminalis]MDN7588754.1 BON domain-containing protein [Burkholderia seminalis]
MDATKTRQRNGARHTPARYPRMRPAASIASLLILSCVGLAIPRHAAADERVGAKLASQASAVGAQIRDATLASRVRAALVAERGLASGDIDVQVRHRVAELSGSVPDEPQRATAIRVAHGVDGVTGVSDKLQIRRK